MTETRLQGYVARWDATLRLGSVHVVGVGFFAFCDRDWTGGGAPLAGLTVTFRPLWRGARSGSALDVAP